MLLIITLYFVNKFLKHSLPIRIQQMAYNTSFESRIKDGYIVESNENDHQPYELQNLKGDPQDITGKSIQIFSQQKDDIGPSLEEITTRSLRRRVDTYQVSFENGILDQHQEALKNIVKKYLEKIFQFQTEVKEFNQQLFENSNLTSSMMPILANEIKQNKWISKQDKLIFIQDIHNEELFDKFLTFVSQTYSKQVFAEFLWVFYLIWLKYVDIRCQYPSEDKHSQNSMQFAEESAENIFLNYDAQYLNLRAQTIKPNLTENQIFEAFKIFIMQLSETVFLVIDGFFANPYYEPRTILPKRTFEQMNSFFLIHRESQQQDSEEMQDSFLQGMPKKKRK